jgi:mono/diheme cytochrome c family protein
VNPPVHPEPRSRSERVPKGMRLFALLLVACGMADQPKAKAQGESPVFSDGRVNRQPPAGTVPRERSLEQPAMTVALLEKGRRRYDVVCATCHGLTGAGDTFVAGMFAGRRPGPLRGDSIPAAHREWLPEISAEERWAIAGYVRALQLSQRAGFKQATPEAQKQLEEAR